MIKKYHVTLVNSNLNNSYKSLVVEVLCPLDKNSTEEIGSFVLKMVDIDLPRVDIATWSISSVEEKGEVAIKC